jgi:hypothetical protein
MENATKYTAEILVKTLATKQARAWGYKSEAAAKKEGYHTRPTSCTVSEATEALSLSRAEVMRLVYAWRDADRVVYSGCADLDTIYFRK